jgi:hypothetical protein
MNEVFIALEIYLLAFIIALAMAFFIQGMLWFTRFITREKEVIKEIKEERKEASV